MQHVLAALKWEKSSSYSILIYVISLFGCPGPSLVRPPSARHWTRILQVSNITFWQWSKNP